MRLRVNMAENGLRPDVYGLAEAGRWLQRRRMFHGLCEVVGIR